MPEHEGIASPASRTALLTIADLCERLQYGRTTIYKLIREGALHPIRVRAHPRFRAEDVELYLESRRESVSDP